jgi:hypothetical protein
VIQSELYLESVCRLGVVLDRHNTGVVDEDIKLIDHGVDGLCCLLNGRVVTKIEGAQSSRRSWHSSP